MSSVACLLHLGSLWWYGCRYWPIVEIDPSCEPRLYVVFQQAGSQDPHHRGPYHREHAWYVLGKYVLVVRASSGAERPSVFLRTRPV
jgi:hypothetical protein